MLTRSGLDIVVGRAMGTVLMTVRGPLKTRSAPDLCDSVDEVLTAAPLLERLVLDLTGVTELDDGAVKVLERAQVAADAAHVRLQLTSRHKATAERLSDCGFSVI